VLCKDPIPEIFQAFDDSDRNSVLTIDVPQDSKTWRGMPRSLRVFDKSGRRVLYSRALFASAAPFGDGMFRFVRRLVYDRAETTLYCNGRTASAPYSFIKVHGVKAACREMPCQTMVSMAAEDTSGLRQRPARVHFEAAEATACIGPVTVEEGTRLFAYSADVEVARHV
jgi:hypothetical protein